MVKWKPTGEYFDRRAERATHPYLKSKFYGVAFLHHAYSGDSQSALDSLGKMIASDPKFIDKFSKTGRTPFPDDFPRNLLLDALAFRRKFGVLPDETSLKFNNSASKNSAHLFSAVKFLFNHREVRGMLRNYFRNRREIEHDLRSSGLMEASAAQKGDKYGKLNSHFLKACRIPASFTYFEAMRLARLLKSRAKNHHESLRTDLQTFLQKRGVESEDAFQLSCLLEPLNVHYAAFHYYDE